MRRFIHRNLGGPRAAWSREVFTETGIEVEVSERLLEPIASTSRASLSVWVFDAGSDGGAEKEIQSLFGPVYDGKRFGLELAGSPLQADILLVCGVVTNVSAPWLRKLHDHIPAPRYVVAVGDEAVSGGICHGSDAVVGGVDKVIPVDMKIPGHPPTPKEILACLVQVLRLKG